MEGRGLKTGEIVMIIGVLFAFTPMFFVILSIILANLNGCTVNEGSVNPCSMFGVEVGGLLYAMFVSGWYSFFTIPAGFFLVAAGGLSALFESSTGAQLPVSKIAGVDDMPKGLTSVLMLSIIVGLFFGVLYGAVMFFAAAVLSSFLKNRKQ